MLKKVLKIALLVFIVAETMSVYAQKRREIEVPTTVVYALPKTVIHADVIAQKTIMKRGPFAQFAEKYLGISNVILSDDTKWKVQSVSISSGAEVDSKHFYKVISSENYEPSLIALTPEGLIRGFNLPSTRQNKEEVMFVQDKEINLEMEYGKFSIDPILKFKTDTIFKVVETDTAFLKVPVLEKQAMKKTLEEKAAEAAHQIFKLRKRRFKILTANYEVLPPDGKAYEVLVKELAKLEAEYVAMFVGKKVSITKAYQFTYSPRVGVNNGTLFRMSAKGPIGANENGGYPVSISFQNLGTTKELVITPVKDVAKDKQIAYRIPGRAEVSVSNGSEEFCKTRMNIAQFGKIAFIPADVLLNENYSVEFYPELGMIKNINKQNIK